MDTLRLLIDNLTSIRDILAPAIQAALLTDTFFDYLQSNGAIASTTTHERITAHLTRYATDLTVIPQYLHYDVGVGAEGVNEAERLDITKRLNHEMLEIFYGRNVSDVNR